MLGQSDHIIYSYLFAPNTVEGCVNAACVFKIHASVNMHRNIYTVSIHHKHDISIFVEVPAEQLFELIAREHNTGAVSTKQHFTPRKQPRYAGYGMLSVYRDDSLFVARDESQRAAET